MFGQMGKGKESFREVGKSKPHASFKRSTLSSQRTLGSGVTRITVQTPAGEDTNEWIATNILDFLNEISLLWSLVSEEAATRFTKPGEGFPAGFEYRWTDSGSGKTTRVSSAEYVDFVLSWIDAQMDDPRIFPVSETEPFPADFQSHYAKDMFKRMFRILAIVYSSHIDKIKSLDASAHLNTVFKHFLFFCLCFDLLEEQEMKALKPQCDRLIEEYHKSDV